MTAYNKNLSATLAGTVTIGNENVINRIGFGTMRLPGPEIWGEPSNPTEAKAVLRRAVELGINYIDTAAFYGPEVSNRLITETLYPYPENLVIGTKVGAVRGSDKSWNSAMHPQSLRAACEDNLRQLRLEQLHLVHCRHMESVVPFADSVAALAALQHEGKIRHIGVSNINQQQLAEAQGITTIVSVQNQYNLVTRDDEDLLNMCTQQNIVFMPYFPLAVGKLGQEQGLLATLAQKYSATPAQIALAWLLARSPIMLPIPGTASVKHLEENIAAAAIRLTDAEIMELERIPQIGRQHG